MDLCARLLGHERHELRGDRESDCLLGLGERAGGEGVVEDIGEEETAEEELGVGVRGVEGDAGSEGEDDVVRVPGDDCHEDLVGSGGGGEGEDVARAGGEGGALGGVEAETVGSAGGGLVGDVGVTLFVETDVAVGTGLGGAEVFVEDKSSRACSADKLVESCAVLTSAAAIWARYTKLSCTYCYCCLRC